ncbi:Protein-serine/threonine phosphatase protein [Dioscorea alata]|uniref:Protein-serine/threonine phosphatase protein n=1 Tax=Dioscorea alata TaxID=55571 RepID=A0ACB7V0R9_DIOAL|nr:Protein-serine/threonine phosphatase protein [Dioscorea alata]
MGCVHGKCCCCRLCCYTCNPCCCSDSGSQTNNHCCVGDQRSPDHLLQRPPLTGDSVGKALIPSADLCLYYSTLSQRGHYPDSPDRENQDCFIVRTNLHGRVDAHFFAVFDGHGQLGARCAAFVRDRLVEALSADGSLFDDPAKAYQSAFLATNSELHESEIDDSMSGTTAIAVLVSGATMCVANVGDSRAVAGVWRNGSVVAEDLSRDQTPFRKDEYERVRRCGARVLSVDQVEGVKDPDVQSWGDEENDDGDPPRLWVPNGMYPGTAFTRSVGDSTAESIGVIAEPEVLTVKISAEHLFFVVASDGVFEFLSSQAVVDMVAKFIDPREACSAIAAESHRLWLEHENRTDDITIIVVHIKDAGTGTIDAASQTTNKSSIEISDKGKDKTAIQESDICHQEKGNLSIMQSCPVDSSTERSPACVAPSPTHSVLRNG